MSNLLRFAAAIPCSVAGLFVLAVADDISSRILSGIMGRLPSSRSNGAQMLAARALEITHSSKPQYWRWVRQTDSRFTEVAELLQVWWMDIKARIKFAELTPETNYSAHLIFRTTPNSKGLDTFQDALVSLGTLQWKKIVCLEPKVAWLGNKSIGLPVERPDGWMELELGNFYCDDGTGDQEVVVSLKEVNDYNEKNGLIVAGVELRPI